MGGCFGRVKREVQVVEPGVGEERISSHAIARNDEVSSKSEDDLQVKGLQNRTATPNASNPGLETSLQSQIRGLNTQQQSKGKSAEVVSHPSGYEEQNIEINMGGGIGRVQREVQVVEPRVGGERISSHAIARNDEGVLEGYKWEFRAWNKVPEKREFSRIYK
uniref:Putative disease resistance protein n=1 Tax=Populus alba TaxID=43335 RepID=A0A4U5MZN1_POPAL|nr:putative disease resistance protein [Populus alba]